jgi:hypothetical protein
MISGPDFRDRKQLLLVRTGIVKENQRRLPTRFGLVGRDKPVSAIRVGANAGLNHSEPDAFISAQDTTASTFDQPEPARPALAAHQVYDRTVS